MIKRVPDVWIDNDSRVWCIDRDGAALWEHVGIHRVMWSRGVERVILYGMLPVAWHLHVFPDGCTLQVVNSSYGNPEWYRSEDVIAEFRHCVVQSKWISKLCPISIQNMDAVTMYVNVSCDISLCAGID